MSAGASTKEALLGQGLEARSVKHTNTEQALGEVAVAASIAPVAGRADPRLFVLLDQLAGVLQIGHQLVALGVQVRVDVVRDLPCTAAEPDPTIEADGAEPQRPAERVRDYPFSGCGPRSGLPAIPMRRW